VTKALFISDTDRLAEALEDLPEAVPWPVLVVVSGLPGTGKSHFCRQLAERLPAVILESDALRKVLFTTPSYSQAESARLFKAIRLLVDRLLAEGIPIIVDATNLTERYRRHFYSIADRRGVKLTLARIEAPPELVRERIEARQANSEERSDASWEVFQEMRDSVDRIERRHYVADTSQDITPVIDKIIREADRQK
jgi:predicted kinase